MCKIKIASCCKMLKNTQEKTRQTLKKYTCTSVLLLPEAAIESPSSTMTNLLWVKLVNRPGAKTEKMKSFPDLGCETWQQCGTVPPQHFWRQ